MPLKDPLLIPLFVASEEGLVEGWGRHAERQSVERTVPVFIALLGIPTQL